MKEGDIVGGKYEVVRMIGLGASGSVYQARHTQLGHEVALKFLRDELRSDTEAMERFFREASAAARIGQENIASVTDMGQDSDGIPFLVMEYIEGKTLAHVMRETRQLDFGRAAIIAIQICRALGAAHDKGIIHRDIKPDNILLVPREDGTELVKVLDFGIAKVRAPLGKESRHLTASGTTLGTPHYMAPEQARAEKDVDGRADVYSTGVLLYEMVTGQQPFTGVSFTDIVVKATQTDPEPPSKLRHDLPQQLEAVILKAMFRQREIRHGNARELADALEPFVPGGSTRLSIAATTSSSPVNDGNLVKGPPTAKVIKAMGSESPPAQSGGGGLLKLVLIGGAVLLVLMLIAGVIGGWILYNAGVETGAAQSTGSDDGDEPPPPPQPTAPMVPMPQTPPPGAVAPTPTLNPAAVAPVATPPSDDENKPPDADSGPGEGEGAPVEEGSEGSSDNIEENQ